MAVNYPVVDYGSWERAWYGTNGPAKCKVPFGTKVIGQNSGKDYDKWILH